MGGKKTKNCTLTWEGGFMKFNNRLWAVSAFDRDFFCPAVLFYLLLFSKKQKILISVKDSLIQTNLIQWDEQPNQ